MVFGCAKKSTNVYLFSYFKGNGEDGLHLAYSKDGLNWDEQKYIPIMHHEPEARNCWAPELFYDEESEQYVIYWATTIPGNFPETDSLGDNGYNHRMYYTTTKDFNEFSDTKILFDQGFNVIDATFLKTDTSYFLFLKDETLLPKAEKNIRISISKEFFGNYTTASAPISPNWVEGPTVTKLDENWIIYFDLYTKGKMGAIISSDLSNWTDISEKINFPEGTRHGTVVKVDEQVLNKLLSNTEKQLFQIKHFAITCR